MLDARRLATLKEDFAAVLALVSAGLGIALLPRLATKKTPPEVAIRPLVDAPLNRRVYTARLRPNSTSAARSFCRVLRSLTAAGG